MITRWRPFDFLRPRRDLDAVQLRHADVEDQHVGLVFVAQPQRVESVGRLADDRDARLGLQQAAQAAPDDSVVVSQQHAQAATSMAAAGSGSCTVSVVPLAGALLMVSAPFSSRPAPRCRAGRGRSRARAGSKPTPSSVTDTSRHRRAPVDAHVERGRAGMANAVGQRFLHGAVDAGAMLVGQGVEIAVDVEIDRHAVAAGEVAHVPLERGLQPEVVEHARPQTEREIADRAHHVVDELAALGRPRWRAAASPDGLSRSSRPSSMRSAVSICPT